MGNNFFRYFDIRNASAITLMGQLCLQWMERKVNEYLNKVIGTDKIEYVFYGDTDSLYINLEGLINKVGMDKFKDTQHLVDFIDKFAKERLEPAMNAASEELKDYMNNFENHLAFDREAIWCPPLETPDGLGAVWKAKKRYAINVYDMEGVRYHTPHLKIMGLETQQSSTPKAIQEFLEESIRLMLQEGEAKVQEYFKYVKEEYEKLDYLQIAAVKTANDISKWSDSNGFPISKCPNHVRGVLTFRRATAGFEGIPNVFDGDKVSVIPLRDGNIFKDKVISWPANTQLPQEIRNDVLVWMDKAAMFESTFVKPLKTLCECAGIEHEKTASLLDMFDF